MRNFTETRKCKNNLCIPSKSVKFLCSSYRKIILLLYVLYENKKNKQEFDPGSE